MSDRPYAIIAAMPGCKPRAIGRSNNRIDADSMVRFLQRKVPNGSFYVIFDPEETCLPIDRVGDNAHRFKREQ